MGTAVCRLGRSGNSARDVQRGGRLPYVLFIWNYLRLLDAWESLSLSSQFALPVVAAWHVLQGRLRGGFSVELSSVVAYLRSGQASREPLDLEPGKPLKLAGTQQLDSTWGHLKLWRSSVGRVKNLVSQKANTKIWDAAYSWVFRRNTLRLQRPKEAALVKALWG